MRYKAGDEILLIMSTLTDEILMPTFCFGQNGAYVRTVQNVAEFCTDNEYFPVRLQDVVLFWHQRTKYDQTHLYIKVLDVRGEWNEEYVTPVERLITYTLDEEQAFTLNAALLNRLNV